LERDEPIERELARLENDAHGAFAQLLEQFVVAQTRDDHGWIWRRLCWKGLLNRRPGLRSGSVLPWRRVGAVGFFGATIRAKVCRCVAGEGHATSFAKPLVFHRQTGRRETSAGGWFGQFGISDFKRDGI